MIDPLAVIAPLLTFVGIVTVALIGGGVTLAVELWKRQVELSKMQAENQMLWLYNRQLVDHIYRGNPPPPPAPPAGLFD